MKQNDYSGDGYVREEFLYRGNVQIHLREQRRLFPICSNREDQIACFIGSMKSKLIHRDFREEPIMAVCHTPFWDRRFGTCCCLQSISLCRSNCCRVRHCSRRDWCLFICFREIIRPISVEKVTITAMARF